MYIEPNTIIRILKNCPLDNTYEHTLYFKTPTAQSAYFYGLTKFTLERQSYQRITTNRMRVSVRAEELYDCNYLMFQNASFGNKWFYAFINSVDYVNNVTSEISFEIDVMQTWLCDYEIQSCYVERNHVLNDKPYKWLAPEPFTVTQYRVSEGDFWQGYAKDIFHDSITEPYINLVYTASYDDEGNVEIGDPPDMYAGVYSGLSYYSVPVSQHDKIAKMIHALDACGKMDGIVGIYMSPLPVTKDALYKNIELPITTSRNDFGSGYTIRNNKLLQSPYVRVVVKSTDGDEVELKPELLGGDKINARLYFIPSLPPSMVFAPKYSGVMPNFDVSVQYTENPQCAWSSDAYANWKATEGLINSYNKATGLLNTGMGVVSTVASAVNNPLRALSTIGQGASNFVASYGNAMSAEVYELKASTLPGKLGGMVNSGNFNYALGRIGFEVWCYRVDAREAKMFDDYLDRFGYAIDEITVPNITGRPHWCYVKTKEISLKGSIPSDDMKKIKSIYNSGVTFWKNGSEVGDYSLDNSLPND